ncbi:cytochrome P450 monooxygenase-like protein [Setomelanomma holmii]|uniref:Cytochrome P450 monooxygenase-like protein n=1 Tax=Setomelanomma holmii TaxID=210430 RepID=A0A9P4LLI5_9PLEO|nr:cytochrome P450 monooxygenase-like protein [Setomelanomma holmii]
MAPSIASTSTDFRFLSPVGIAGFFVVFSAAYILYNFVYNVFLHPLKHIPGPRLAASTGIPYALHMRNGSMVAWIKQLHDQYGDAVRIAPNEVSFISGETAWPDIYGFRTGKYKNTGAYLKDLAWFPIPINKTWSLLAADEANHSRVRRNLAHAFSDKALRDQEPLIQKYVDLLVHRLGEHAAESKAVDIMQWYNYTTFDVICDLTFGEPLYSLRDSKEHHWIRLVFASVKAIGLLSTRVKYPMFQYIEKLKTLFKNTANINAARLEFFKLAHDKVERRLEKGTDRPDFFSYITKSQEIEAKALTRDEMDSNSTLFLAAGSETTATILSGVTYLLLANRDKLSKLIYEIRSRFTSASEITIEEVNKLEYMIACLQEALRMYPPVPTGFPRVVPVGGDHISGYFIPAGTSVYVSQHAMNHSTRNYKDPERFVPERWMGAEEYKDDNRESLQPFSFGPRNCLGKNLAYAEMRLILAKVLFTFDLALQSQSALWMRDQKVFTLWEKPALMVDLKTVQR